MPELINLVKKGHVAELILNRPPANAFNRRAYHELLEAVEDINADETIYVSVIRSENQRFFSAGNDVHEFNDPNFHSDVDDDAGIVDRSLSAILRSPKPFISLVDGIVAGSGFSVVSYSDVIVATPHARFGIPEVKRGIVGGVPEAAFSLTPKLARYAALTGNFIGAEQAYATGFVARLAEPDQLQKVGEEIAQTIIGNPPLTVQFVKQSLANIFPPQKVLDQIVADEPRLRASIATEDFHESVNAFLEKRQPVYHSR